MSLHNKSNSPDGFKWLIHGHVVIYMSWTSWPEVIGFVDLKLGRTDAMRSDGGGLDAAGMGRGQLSVSSSRLVICQSSSPHQDDGHLRPGDGQGRTATRTKGCDGRRVATDRQQTPVHCRTDPPTAIAPLCSAHTITINYRRTACRGNQAFVSSYVGGAPRPVQSSPVTQSIGAAARC